MKLFSWWFFWGGMTTLAVLVLQGGVADFITKSGSPLIENLFNFVTTIAAGGLLAGCIATILNRIRQR